MRDIAYGAAFAVIFAVVTAAAAFALGYWWAVDYERTTGYGGGNAPVIVFVLATPIGALVGFFFGLWLASRPQRLSGPTEDQVNAAQPSSHLSKDSDNLG